jgi:hypothetical protein
MRHGFRVGAGLSRKLNFYFPAVMVGCFDDLSEALRRDDVDDAHLADIARRQAMEIVGPVPEGYVGTVFPPRSVAMPRLECGPSARMWRNW